MDAARDQAGEALRSSPSGVPFWMNILTHLVAFGLGTVFSQHFWIDSRLMKLEEAVKDLQRA